MGNFIVEYLEQYFDEVEPLDFYRAVFPVGELEEQGTHEKGKYHGIAVELLPKEEEKQNARRYIIYNDLKEIEKLLFSDNFVIISPISYIGKSRKSENARFMYALAIDLDGIVKKQNMIDLFYQQKNNYLPKPTFIVFSGNGIHLYYVFEKPIPLFKNIIKQLAKLKHELTRKIWNGYVTSLENNVQYESLFQGFRLAGGVAKDGSRTRIFSIGDKVSIDYLNSFVEKEYRVTQSIYNSNLSIEEAKKLYPEWYEKRVVQGRPKGTWTCKRDLFDWWLRRLKSEITVGHRYYGVMVLAVYAKKCGISQEELEHVAFGLIDFLDKMTEEEDNHFTRQDVLSALEMYNDSYITFPIDTITELTDILIVKNKRNYRKQKVHLQIARATKEILIATGENVKGGRPSKEHIVKEWLRNNPTGRKVECINETGLAKGTVYKYWNR